MKVLDVVKFINYVTPAAAPGAFKKRGPLSELIKGAKVAKQNK